MSQKKKIYFISDIHLGAPALTNNLEREKLFVKWLDEIKDDASELFLLGDIFDYWFEFKKVVPRGFTRSLGKIAELADSGIKVHFFTGNHDVWVFDYLPSELGVILHKKEFKVELEGKKFYLAHGDGIGPGDMGYKLLRKLFHSSILQWLFARLHPNFTVGVGHAWSKKSRLTNNEIGESDKKNEEPLFVFSKSILEKEHFDYFIYGHRHLLVKQPLAPNSDFVILGEWINKYSYGVFDGERFELKKYK